MKQGSGSAATTAFKDFATAAFVLAASLLPAAARASIETPAPALPEAEEARVAHARELLGKYYRKSAARVGERLPAAASFVREETRESLKGPKRVSAQVARAIVDEARKHELDPIFLMAVIQAESSFDPRKVGTSGEIGLMQILPATGKWIARKFGLPWKGKRTLRDPVQNVRIGAAYISYLREEFDSHSRLYLAAYNMGPLNVRKALSRKVWPKDYPIRVMERYIQYYSDLKERLQNSPAPQDHPGSVRN